MFSLLTRSVSMDPKDNVIMRLTCTFTDILLMVNKELNVVTAHLFGILADQKSSKVSIHKTRQIMHIFKLFLDNVRVRFIIMASLFSYG